MLIQHGIDRTASIVTLQTKTALWFHLRSTSGQASKWSFWSPTQRNSRRL